MFYFAEGRSLVALFLFLYPHPSVDSVDSSPLWEPFLPLLEEWWQHPKLNLYKINLNLFQKTIDKQKNVCYNELINQ